MKPIRYIYMFILRDISFQTGRTIYLRIPSSYEKDIYILSNTRN